jgi:hypothetical protein
MGDTAIQALQIKAKTRPDLVIQYGPEDEQTEYRLSGRIPAEIMTIRAQYKKPKNPEKKVQEEWQRELGVATMDKFLELVVPSDLRAVVDLEDLETIFEHWAGHVGLGESKDSDS